MIPGPIVLNVEGVDPNGPAPVPVPQFDDGWFRSVRNVTVPTLTPFSPDPEKANGTSVLVCPGGGWHLLSIESEGEWVAEALAALGVTAFVLNYRTVWTEPSDAGWLRTKRATADLGYLAETEQSARPRGATDGAAAVRYLRCHAEELGIDPHRIGMLGFSAGGHVALASTVLNPPDACPDWIAPIYPVAWPGFAVPDALPPLFLAWASDDDLGPIMTESTLGVYRAWLAAGAPAELHAYERGGHGFGLEERGTPTDRWFADLVAWMRGRDLLA
nr:alpha/beta hydrolase [Actinomycetales bacterium]